MQIYKTPMGTRFFVIDGVVYACSGGKVRRSILSVKDMLYAIEHGLIKFHALADVYHYERMMEHVKCAN